jgi:hypothetical protein
VSLGQLLRGRDVQTDLGDQPRRGPDLPLHAGSCRAVRFKFTVKRWSNDQGLDHLRDDQACDLGFLVGVAGFESTTSSSRSQQLWVWACQASIRVVSTDGPAWRVSALGHSYDANASLVTWSGGGAWSVRGCRNGFRLSQRLPAWLRTSPASFPKACPGVSSLPRHDGGNVKDDEYFPGGVTPRDERRGRRLPPIR